MLNRCPCGCRAIPNMRFCSETCRERYKARNKKEIAEYLDRLNGHQTPHA